MSSYRQADNWARANLDSITYESDVESLPDGRVRIQYLDRILHKNNRHDHRCCQVITVGGDDLIVRIEHEDLAGEREAIDDFFASAGLRRDCDEAT
jgi:hypothetical protein